MVERIDQGNVEKFLNGWHDNRIRVLLFGKTEVIRLRYLTTAFKFRSRAKLGYVQLTDPYAKKIISKYNMAKTKGKKHALNKYEQFIRNTSCFCCVKFSQFWSHFCGV